MLHRLGHDEIVLGGLHGTRSVLVDSLCTHLIQLTLVTVIVTGKVYTKLYISEKTIRGRLFTTRPPDIISSRCRVFCQLPTFVTF